MICRHAPGDHDCSSHPDRIYEAAEESAREVARAEAMAKARMVLGMSTPDPSTFNIEFFERVGPNVVMQIRYPNCAACAFEGIKTCVWLDVTEREVVSWRKIDPHFRGKSPFKTATPEAPSPDARFPGTPEGLQNAIEWARSMKAKAVQRDD